MAIFPKRAREVFDAALDLPEAEARRAYIIGACGDDLELRV
jgi:hypothetical protein